MTTWVKILTAKSSAANSDPGTLLRHHFKSLGVGYINFSIRDYTPTQIRNLNLNVAIMSVPSIIYPFPNPLPANYPQFIFGFTFATGIIISCHMLGVDPLKDHITILATLCLCMSKNFWAMIYDTIYANPDLEDDL